MLDKKDKYPILKFRIRNNVLIPNSPFFAIRFSVNPLGHVEVVVVFNSS